MRAKPRRWSSLAGAIAIAAVFVACNTSGPSNQPADAGVTVDCRGNDCRSICADCAEPGPDSCVAGDCLPTGSCVESMPCDDGDSCTSDDKCVDGTCTGKPYSCDDSFECTVDTCDGAGDCEFKLKPGRCLINGACYKEGEQQAGNECRECMTPVSASEWSADDANSCSDEDQCTLDDYCLDGQCKGATKLECYDGNPCTDDACLPESGCSFVDSDAPCDDANECTKKDSCSKGECKGTAVDCNDGNPCTAEACEYGKGCVYAAVGGPCNDGNLCTTADSCADGVCQPGSKPLDCDDQNPCTSDLCKPMSGCAHKEASGPCDDGNKCTIGDSCVAGECMPGSLPPGCNDGNSCTADTCLPETGCGYAPVEGFCNDGNLCTVGDLCAAGQCVAGPKALACDDGDPCTDDSCKPQSGCAHTYNKAGCDDGNECTVSDSCLLGQCLGQLKSCNDNNVCTTDSCNPFTPGGCTHLPNALSCEDGDPCSLGDGCVAGECQPGETEMPCDDYNPCTEDSCNPGFGCRHLNIVEYCDDGNPCTDGDYCDAGKCMSGWNICLCQTDAGCIPYDDGDLCNGTLFCDKSSPNPTNWQCAGKPGSQVDCDHSQDTECMATKCVPYSGKCVKFPTNEAAPCDDSNHCTAGDYCAAGSCFGPVTVVCDDDNECTTDSCSPQYGCLFKPVLGGTPCGPVGWQCAGGQCVPCAPNCLGRECGSDGCAGVCGYCSGDKVCDNGTCVSVGVLECKGASQSSYPSCGDISSEGCCREDRVYYCGDGKLFCLNCPQTGLHCGWDSGSGFYDCEYHTKSDPSGKHPQECAGCIPPCPPGYVCYDSDCVSCVPNCGGKECGADGCSGSCGTCPMGDMCVDGVCVPQAGLEECKGTGEASYPYCAGIDYTGCCDAQGRVLWCEGGSLYCLDCSNSPSCGWEAEAQYYNCGTTGGGDPSGQHPKNCTACIPACWPGYACVEGQCVGCVPDCSSKECGSDGCGGSCGTCPPGQSCSGGGCQVVSACGNLTQEGKCDGDVAVWCQNNQVWEHDCAPEGKKCAYLDDYKKYGCKVDCGDVPDEGYCEGTELHSCTESGVAVKECEDFGMGCDFDDDQEKYGCVNGCGNIDYYGQCEGDVLSYCSSPYGNGGTIITVDCAEYGMVCSLENESSGYDCVDACGGVASSGYCDGDKLIYCDTNQDPPEVVTVDCALLGLICDLVDPDQGHACLPAQGGGDMVVSGSIMFDKRIPALVGFGPTVQEPARQIKVSLWDTNGTENNEDDDLSISSGFTDNAGNFKLFYDDPGTKVYLVAYAWWGQGQTTLHVDVSEDSGGWYSQWSTVAVSTEPFTPAPDISKSLHILVAKSSGAFNILDQMLKARAFTIEHLGPPPSVWVQWDGPVGDAWCWYGSYYDPKEAYIHIANCGNDPDEFDDSVVLHEFGHHVTSTMSKDDNPGGAHWVEWTVDPRMAWSEGFATFFGQAIRNDPVYIDAAESDSLVYDLEGASEMCPAKSYLGMTQDLCEAMTGGALWDLSDDANTEFDTLALGPDEVMDVMGHYFTDPSFQDRGVTGIDFVDFLDGWFCRGHQQFSGLNTLIVEGAQFPYDFGGPCSKLQSPVHMTLVAAPVETGLFEITATLWTTIEAYDIHVKFVGGEGARVAGAEHPITLDLVPGEAKTVRWAVELTGAGARVGAVAAHSNNPALRYSTSAAVDLGQLPVADRGRGGRMPDGTRARIWQLSSSSEVR